MRHFTRLLALTAIGATIALVAAGCGGSSKPSYCGKVETLKTDVNNLSSSSTGGVGALKTKLNQLESDATAIVASAHSDFPSQTAAITSSVTQLKSELAGLGSSPNAAQLVSITSSAKDFATAVGDFVTATKSKCQ